MQKAEIVSMVWAQDANNLAATLQFARNGAAQEAIIKAAMMPPQFHWNGWTAVASDIMSKLHDRVAQYGDSAFPLTTAQCDIIAQCLCSGHLAPEPSVTVEVNAIEIALEMCQVTATGRDKFLPVAVREALLAHSAWSPQAESREIARVQNILNDWAQEHNGNLLAARDAFYWGGSAAPHKH